MKPLIFDFQLSRKESDNPILYQYDEDESLNVIFINGEKRPFIDLKAEDVELLTKTLAHREKDDDNFLLELGTKTEAARERDDRHDTILEMLTKTFSTREREGNE